MNASMPDCLSLRDRYFAPGLGHSEDPMWLAHLQRCNQCRAAYQALPYVDSALAEIAQHRVTVPPFEALAGVAVGAARGQRRRRAIRRSVPFFYTAFGTAALAAGLIVAVLVGRAHQLAPKLLVPGAEIQATGEAKSAFLATGVRIRLEAGSLKLASSSNENQALVMSSGRVSLEVPKLPVGSTLSVRTPDAEVRVHGTRFQVIRTGRETQVVVAEGLVEVRPEGIGRPIQMLKMGESTIVPSAEAYREGLRHATLAALDHGQFGAAEKQIAQLLGFTPDAAQQAEAQALLAWSLSARGKRSEAIARYRQALALLPEPRRPLWAENACAELAILVQQGNPQQSAGIWAECLRRFPDGVHAALARSQVHSTK
jgi:ferric-dicitrate binding protein FerR (iron transport regulator)